MRIFSIALLMWAVASAALADDWTANKLRGQVVQLVDNEWKPLSRGMVVPDSRIIRTLANGRVTFTRGNEMVEIGPDSQIQIYDKGGRKPFTTVKQYFGTVSVEAEVEQVQHFAVQTPYLAAVVKGTRFTVHSGKTGADVEVRRGHVAVEDKHNGSHVTLSVGQVASIDTQKTGGEISVTGSGELPVVVGANGKPFAPLSPKELKAAEERAKKAADAETKAAKHAAKSADSSGNGHSGRGGGGNSGSGGSGSGNSGSGSSGSNGTGSGHSVGDDSGKGKKGKDK